jgi:hypothetical protein
MPILTGGKFNDTLTGTSSDDELWGNSGDDTLKGGAGDDQIVTGEGNDYAYGGSGDDKINGSLTPEGEYDYEYWASSGTQWLYGNDGNDTVFGGSDVDNIDGGIGNDHLDGLEGNDVITGGEGNDTLDGDAGNDKLYGGAGNDDLYGREGDDNLFGGAGNDDLAGQAGFNILDGGSGLDFSIYYYPIAQYSILNTGDKTWTVNNAVNNDTDNLLNVERAYFTDKTVAFDIGAGEIGGSCYRIYKAAFNRTPDEGGLGYWIDQMDLGKDLYSVSAEFIGSNEFKTLYGTNPSNDDFLTKVYSNVLGREPDIGGYAWWLGQLETNASKTWPQVLTDFSESTENRESVLALIGNGLEYDYYWAV